MIVIPSLAILKNSHFQTDCHEDMVGILQKLSSLKHNTTGVVEPTQQLYNKFVIEESLM